MKKLNYVMIFLLLIYTITFSVKSVKYHVKNVETIQQLNSENKSRSLYTLSWISLFTAILLTNLKKEENKKESVGIKIPSKIPIKYECKNPLIIKTLDDKFQTAGGFDAEFIEVTQQEFDEYKDALTMSDKQAEFEYLCVVGELPKHRRECDYWYKQKEMYYCGVKLKLKNN